jgi:pyruvate,water dikinase
LPQPPDIVPLDDTRIAPDLLPPAESRWERLSSRAATGAFVVWGIVLALLWYFPPFWHAAVRIFDLPLWPLVDALGRPAAVAVLAAATAFLTMLAQLLLTDTRRLRVVKQRAHILHRQQRALPLHSPREDALHAVVTRAQWRIARASLVPAGILLGPMIAIFFWFPARVDPADINPPPGAAVTLTAHLDAAYIGPILLSLDGQALPPQDGRQTLTWPITLPAGTPAVHRLTLSASPASVQFDLPTGDAAPPPLHPQRQPNGFAWQEPGAGIIKNITITCPDPRTPDELAFWRPFAWAGWHWDAGWMGLYFVVYFPAIYLARRLLRVP